MEELINQLNILFTEVMDSYAETSDLKNHAVARLRVAMLEARVNGCIFWAEPQLVPRDEFENILLETDDLSNVQEYIDAKTAIDEKRRKLIALNEFEEAAKIMDDIRSLEMKTVNSIKASKSELVTNTPVFMMAQDGHKEIIHYLHYGSPPFNLIEKISRQELLSKKAGLLDDWIKDARHVDCYITLTAGSNQTLPANTRRLFDRKLLKTITQAEYDECSQNLDGLVHIVANDPTLAAVEAGINDFGLMEVWHLTFKPDGDTDLPVVLAYLPYDDTFLATLNKPVKEPETKDNDVQRLLLGAIKKMGYQKFKDYLRERRLV